MKQSVESGARRHPNGVVFMARQDAIPNRGELRLAGLMHNRGFGVELIRETYHNNALWIGISCTSNGAEVFEALRFSPEMSLIKDADVPELYRDYVEDPSFALRVYTPDKLFSRVPWDEPTKHRFVALRLSRLAETALQWADVFVAKDEESVKKAAEIIYQNGRSFSARQLRGFAEAMLAQSQQVLAAYGYPMREADLQSLTGGVISRYFPDPSKEAKYASRLGAKYAEEVRAYRHGH